MRTYLLPLTLCLSLVACGESFVPGDAGPAPTDAGPAPVDAGPAPNPIRLADVFSTPESAHWDSARGVWYVTSFGQPFGQTPDAPAFISRLSADGTVLDARFVETEGDLVGMALLDGTLYVSRAVDLLVVEPDSGDVTTIEVEGAGFLNDVAAGDGVLYVSDTGSNRVLRYTPGGAVEVFSEDPALVAPNGVAVRDGEVFVVTLGAFPPDPTTPGGIFRLDADGAATRFGELDGLFDGIERDGADWIVSDVVNARVHRVGADGAATVVWDASADGLTSTADIGFDPARRLLLAPDLFGDAAYLYAL